MVEHWNSSTRLTSSRSFSTSFCVQTWKQNKSFSDKTTNSLHGCTLCVYIPVLHSCTASSPNFSTASYRTFHTVYSKSYKPNVTISHTTELTGYKSECRCTRYLTYLHLRQVPGLGLKGIVKLLVLLTQMLHFIKHNFTLGEQWCNSDAIRSEH